MKRIIISRVDNLGDVILTLPLAGVLKELFPESYILFLAKSYTKPLVDSCIHIDEFVDWNLLEGLSDDRLIEQLKELKADVVVHVMPHARIAKLAAKAGIPERIGTSRRLYNAIWCNRKLNYSRRKSNLHEAQMNLQLLHPLGAKHLFRLDEVPDYYGFTNLPSLKDEFATLISKEHFNLILHPLSKGSAREWGLDNFSRLIDLIPSEKYRIFITGTEDEGRKMEDITSRHTGKIVNMAGRLDMEQLLAFINHADALVAASTGPLHISAAIGKPTIGLYAPMRPIHPGRWAAVGKKAEFLVVEKICEDCRKNYDCHCIKSITPEHVLERIERYYRGDSRSEIN